MRKPMSLRRLRGPILFFVAFCVLGGLLGMWINHRIQELENRNDVASQWDRG